MNKSEIISHNLGIIQHERIVRDYLAEGKLLDVKLLKLVCKDNKSIYKKLEKYLGFNIELFHSKAVCGGVLMRNEDKNKDQS